MSAESRAHVTTAEGHPKRWQILPIMCTCLVLVVAGVSSLNIAIPSIVRALDASQTEQLWIVDAYALVFAGLLLPAGAIGDRYGRKGALLSGLSVFALASVAAAYANDPTQLIVARAAMGVGAAFVMPATLSIITAVFPPHERAKAIAIWAGFAGAGGSIGVIAGGALLEKFWWGSVFFIAVPIAGAAALMIAAVVPTSRDDDQRPLDPIGALLSIVGLGSLVYAIIEGGEVGWAEGATIGWFVAAAVFLTGFVRYELSRPDPMLDPHFFRSPRFTLGSFTLTMSFAVMFGMFFLITLFFQFVQGHSPLQAGLRNLPFAATMIVVAPRAPKIAARLGAHVSVATGLLLQAIGFVLLSQLRPDTDYWYIVIGLVLAAAGMGMLMPPSTDNIVSSLPSNKAGVGSAWNDTVREVGGALGIAVLGTLLATGYRDSLGGATDQLPPEAGDLFRDSIGGAYAVAGQLGDSPLVQPLLDTANSAFTDGLQVAFIVAAAIGVVNAAVTLAFYPRDDVERDSRRVATRQ